MSTPANRADNARGKDTSSIGEIYSVFMNRIETMPHVNHDLGVLIEYGIDKKSILFHLAAAAFMRHVNLKARIKKQESRLQRVAADIYTLANQVEEIAEDPNTLVKHWLVMHGLGGAMSLVFDDPPGSTGDEMRRFAQWLDCNRQGLAKLRSALDRGNPAIIFLMDYVKRSTGAYQDVILARLLNAAVDAVDDVLSEDEAWTWARSRLPMRQKPTRKKASSTFSEETLKKFRQRLPGHEQHVSTTIAEIAGMFPRKYRDL